MTVSVLGSQGISGVPQTMMSARSQVRWVALKGTSSGHPPLLIERSSINGLVDQVGRGRIGHPGAGAPCGLPLVGLHPDHRVHQVRYFPPSGTVAFDDQQRAVGRNLDGSLPAVLVPPGREPASGEGMPSDWALAGRDR
jgi:hypothetical protein